MAFLPREIIFLVSEFGILALFAACLAVARRADVSTQRHAFRGVVVLFSAAVFAAIFENLNVIQIHGRGSYFYHADFLLDVFHVPLFIILAWAIILWGARVLVGKTPSRADAKTIFLLGCRDAILAVLLDLSFDVVAIRFGFWTWRGFAFDDAWFGVPAGNFFGWLFVSLAFSWLTRALESRWPRSPRTQHWVQIIALPVAAFVLYRAMESVTHFLLRALSLSSDEKSLVAFFALFITIAIIAFTTRTLSTQASESERKTAHVSRLAFHAFAVFGLWFVTTAALPGNQLAILLALAILVGALDFVWTMRKKPHENPQ